MKNGNAPHTNLTGAEEKKDKVLVIKGDSRLLDMQQLFSTLYPFLKIGFFQSSTGATLNKIVAIDSNTFISKLIHEKDCTINISPGKTVSELAHECQSKMGLMIQVSRKSGTVWNVISITEGWTLEGQNAAGEFISSEMAGTTKK